MNSRAASRVDMRGFSWRLEPLQRKLEWELDGARVRLGTAHRQAEDAQEVLRRLRAASAEQAAVAADLMRSRIDARAHGHALAYLAAQGRRIEAASRAQAAALQELEGAREKCLDCQRRLDTLAAIRDEAIGEHERKELQREAKAADAAWLAGKLALESDSMEGRFV